MVFSYRCCESVLLSAAQTSMLALYDGVNIYDDRCKALANDQNHGKAWIARSASWTLPAGTQTPIATTSGTSSLSPWRAGKRGDHRRRDQLSQEGRVGRRGSLPVHGNGRQEGEHPGRDVPGYASERYRGRCRAPTQLGGTS